MRRNPVFGDAWDGLYATKPRGYVQFGGILCDETTRMGLE